MLSSTVEQTVQTVKTDTRARVVYRAAITGRICRAVVIREIGDLLKVQGDDYNGDVRIIQRDDVLNYIPAETDPAPEMPSESPKTAPRSDLDVSQPLPHTIKPVDPARAKSRYEALAAERYCQWQAEKNYLGNIPLVEGDQQQLCRILEAHARYGAVLRHVERLGGNSAPPCPTRPTVKAGDVFTALAIAALVELGTAEYTVAADVSAELHTAISAAMDAGQLHYRQDIIGELPTAPGRGVNLARSPLYYQWAAQS